MLKKIKTNIKSGGKIILRATREPQPTTRLSFANLDIDSSERSATNTESDDDQNNDYNYEYYNIKSGVTRNSSSSKLSRQRYNKLSIFLETLQLFIYPDLNSN